MKQIEQLLKDRKRCECCDSILGHGESGLCLDCEQHKHKAEQLQKERKRNERFGPKW